MSIVVTGGCGFIGSHLVDELTRRGAEVRVIGLQCELENLSHIIDKIHFSRLDIRDRDALYADIPADTEGIIHLAALVNVDHSIESPQPFFEVNVRGSMNVVEVARMKNIPKLLYMSTCEVYGNIPKGRANEDYPTNPCSPYAASKFAAERYLLSYAYTYGKPDIVIIRGFNQYGPRQGAGHKGAVISRFTTRLLKNEKIQVHGSGAQTRDYLYVEDTVRGIADAFGKNLPSGEVINLATGKEISIKDIATIVCQIAGKEPEKYVEFVADRPGQLMRSCGNHSRAKDLLGWEPKVSFEEGLRLTFQWYKENLENLSSL